MKSSGFKNIMNQINLPTGIQKYFFYWNLPVRRYVCFDSHKEKIG